MRIWLSLTFIALTGIIGCTKRAGFDSATSKVVVREIQRTDVQVGNGKVATAGTTAEIQFTVLSARGKILRSNRADKKPERVKVDAKLDPKMPFGYFVEGMAVGGRRRITLPWGAEFGNSDASGEPLIYEIDLTRVSD